MHGAFELRIGRVCLRCLKYIITANLQTRELSVVFFQRIISRPLDELKINYDEHSVYELMNKILGFYLMLLLRIEDVSDIFYFIKLVFPLMIEGVLLFTCQILTKLHKT